MLPKAVQKAIDEIGMLPGVGPRTAQRYVLALLKYGSDRTAKLNSALSELHSGVAYCEKTFAFTEPGNKVSALYDNPDRNKTIVLVVADPFDVIALEQTGDFKGVYHVLGGLLSPIDGIGPDKLKIKELLQRIDQDEVKEIILALSAGVEGESTSLYIQKILADKELKLSRLAHGIPVGLDIEYADRMTLSRALEHRQAITK